MKPMKCIYLLFIVFLALLSACVYLPVQPPVASALDDPGVPFKSGVTIRKPAPTPSLKPAPLQSETITSTPVPPAETPLPTDDSSSQATDAEIQLAFSEDAFVINDDYQPPVVGVGYDSTTANDSPPEYSGSKYILVDISEQHMYVYEGGTLVYSFVSSTGMNNSTRVGTFSVLNKISNAYGATWNIWMPHWLGIYWSGSLQNGIHALPILPNGATLWAGYLGTPISYGCVVLGTYEALTLYNWADIGTPVEIRW